MSKKKKFVSATRFADLYGERGDHYRTPRQIRRLAGNGQIEGARKVAGLGWAIPEDAKVLNLQRGAKRISIEEDPEGAMREALALARHVLGHRDDEE
jgi:hypothetical protein